MRSPVPAVLILLGLCGGLIQPAQGEDRITLRFGQIANSARSVSSIALTVAQRKGFLEREGIDLKVVGLRGTQYQIEELDKGSVELSHTATPYLIQAVLAGSSSVAVVGAAANTIYSLIAQPQIKSFDDLRGKLVGLSLPVDTISIASRMLLEKHGLGDAAYRSKELVGTPVRAECLMRGECAAVPLGQPDDIVLAQKGFTKLGDSLEVIPSLQFSVIAARRDWAAANRDAVLRFTRAFAAAYRFMRDPANRDEMTRITAEIDRRAARGGARRAELLLRARPRRDAAASRDRHDGPDRGDRAARPHRRAQGPAAVRRTLRRPAIPQGRRAAVAAPIPTDLILRKRRTSRGCLEGWPRARFHPSRRVAARRSSDRMSPSREEATHPRCRCEGYPDRPGRASSKEGESWSIVAKLS